MSEQNPVYRDNNNSVQEQIPHSNVHHDEPPYREYKETPLDQAPLDIQPADIHDTSHLPVDLQVSPLKPESQREKAGLGWKKPIAIIALTTAAIGGAFGAKQAFGGDSETTPSPESQPTASAPEVPGEVETTPAESTPTSNPEDEFTPIEITEPQHDLPADDLLLIVNFSTLNYSNLYYMLERVSSQEIYGIDAFVDINRDALENGDQSTLGSLDALIDSALMRTGFIYNPYQ